MTIWGVNRGRRRSYIAYRRTYRCFFAMDNRTLVGREDDAQPRRASRGTDRRHDSSNIGRILCAASRVSNLASATYFLGV
jgi:hypothetical protein